MFWSIFGGYWLYYLQQNIVLIMVTIAMIGILWNNSTIGKRDVSSFRHVVLVLFIMSFFDSFDHYVDTLGTGVPEALIVLRYGASIISYMMKPAVPMLVAYGVLKSHNKNRKFLWTIEATNVLLFAFNFIPATRFYEITSDNIYVRIDPVGWFTFMPFVFGAAYLVITLIHSYLIFISDKKIGESIAIIGVSIGAVGGYAIESAFTIYNLGNQTTAIGILFFYLFLVIKYTKIDPLTNLYNRQTFFSSFKFNKNVTALISIDMNNLKYFNDNFGHSKGDEALMVIAGLIKEIQDRNISGYRMGGDEFLVVCQNMSEEQVKIVVSKLNFSINKNSEYEVAIGYSFRNNNDPFEYLMAAADESMYTQKAQMKKDTLKVKKILHRK